MKKIESKALLIGFFINVIMGFAGWYMFIVTDIDALFLDGNFSLISALGCIGAIFISKYSDKKTKRFPNGLYFLEPLYGTLKGLLSFVLIIIAGISAIIKLYNYLFLDKGTMIAMGNILYYSLAMTFLCFLLSFVFFQYNKKIKNRSTMLRVESKASLVDGIISLALGISILLITLLPKQGNTIFVYYIGDALITLLMIILTIRQPAEELKESFIELMLGVIKPNKMQMEIEKIVDNVVKKYENIQVKDINIYKTGKDLLLLLRVKSLKGNETVKTILNFKKIVAEEIEKNYQQFDIELVLE